MVNVRADWRDSVLIHDRDKSGLGRASGNIGVFSGAVCAVATGLSVAAGLSADGRSALLGYFEVCTVFMADSRGCECHTSQESFWVRLSASGATAVSSSIKQGEYLHRTKDWASSGGVRVGPIVLDDVNSDTEFKRCRKCRFRWAETLVSGTVAESSRTPSYMIGDEASVFTVAASGRARQLRPILVTASTAANDWSATQQKAREVQK